MSVVKNNIRIANKIDTIDNWSASKLSLLNGEIAIVSCDSNDIKIKVGDGITPISALPYVNDKQITDVSDEVKKIANDLSNYAELSATKPLSGETYQLSATSLSTFILDIVKSLGGTVLNGNVIL